MANPLMLPAPSTLPVKGVTPAPAKTKKRQHKKKSYREHRKMNWWETRNAGPGVEAIIGCYGGLRYAKGAVPLPEVRNQEVVETGDIIIKSTSWKTEVLTVKTISNEQCVAYDTFNIPSYVKCSEASLYRKSQVAYNKVREKAFDRRLKRLQRRLDKNKEVKVSVVLDDHAAPDYDLVKKIVARVLGEIHVTRDGFLLLRLGSDDAEGMLAQRVKAAFADHAVALAEKAATSAIAPTYVYTSSVNAWDEFSD